MQCPLCGLTKTKTNLIRGCIRALPCTVCNRHIKRRRTNTDYHGLVGRPLRHIDVERVQTLLDSGLTMTQVAKDMNVPLRTMARRVAGYDVRYR